MKSKTSDRSTINVYITTLICLICLILCSCSLENRELDDESSAPSVDLVSPSDSVRIFGPEVISTALYERDIAISPDEREIIYTKSDYRQRKRVLVSVRMSENRWQEAEVLPFSGIYQDIEPFLAHGGERLYFASDRPIFGDSARSDYNIWYSDRISGGWSDPEPLDSMINTKGDEYYPSLSAVGNLYFTATREEGFGREDIFLSVLIDQEYQSPVALPESINSDSYEFNAFVDPRERYLLFSSFGRKDDMGGGDLYISEKSADGQWQNARNLGSLINSNGLDYCPFVDARERRLYFTSERASGIPEHIHTLDNLNSWANSPGNGLGNIYYIDLSALGLGEN